MMKIVTAVVILFYALDAQAQKDNDLDFMQSVGLSYYTSFLTQAPAIHYQPRLDFYEISDKATVGFEIRLAGGYFEENQSLAGDSYLVFQIPAMVNFNYGCAATRVTKEQIGYYAGLGVGNEIDYDYRNKFIQNYFWGPMANAGFRFDVAEKSPLDINVAFMYDISGNYNNVLSAGISYMFGMLR